MAHNASLPGCWPRAKNELLFTISNWVAKINSANGESWGSGIRRLTAKDAKSAKECGEIYHETHEAH